MNHLRLPVTVTAAGTSPTLVSSTSTIVFPGGTTAVTWTEEDEKYSDGTPIPDDLGPTSILVADKATLTISNVIGTTTYFEAYLKNTSGVTLGVAIAHGTELRCLGSQGSGSGSARWGYYTLTSQTEWRVYRTSSCTGAFSMWSASTISSGMFGNGTVILEVTTPP